MPGGRRPAQRAEWLRAGGDRTGNDTVHGVDTVDRDSVDTVHGKPDSAVDGHVFRRQPIDERAGHATEHDVDLVEGRGSVLGELAPTV